MDNIMKNSNRHIYILDPGCIPENILFSLNNSNEAICLDGDEAGRFANALNITARPAIVIADSSYLVLGVLSKPETLQQVAGFISDPAAYGYIPELPAMPQPVSARLINGVPEKWLVGGIIGGSSGMELFGLESDKKLRPNPGNRYIKTNILEDIGVGSWENSVPEPGGKCIITGCTHDNSWAKQTGYAQLYLYAKQTTEVILHLGHNGIEAFGWLDEVPLRLVDAGNLPDDFPALQLEPEMPRAAVFILNSGWHSLKIKIINALPTESEFFFSAKFTDLSGHGSSGILTQTADPMCDLTKNAFASMLVPSIRVNAPANIPYSGESITVDADMHWHPMNTDKFLPYPILPFKAVLCLTITDYDGCIISRHEVTGTFPGQLSVELGTAPSPGYYAIRPELYTGDGKTVEIYPTDGFTVMVGNTAQKERLARKKIWDNNYYAFVNKVPTDNWDFISYWLERTGIFQTIGSDQQVTPEDLEKWKDAKDRGFNIFADFSGDSPVMNNTREKCWNYVNKVKSYTRFYKSTNELDNRTEEIFLEMRKPENWVSRCKWEYEAVKAENSEACYIGASLVRPGDMRDDGFPDKGPGKWFVQCLSLGLEQWVDAWDIHAYPQYAPNLDGMFCNSPNEGENGVDYAYSTLGRINTKPFIYAEVGAIANHGQTGLRWQAEAVAKMVAWVCCRENYLGISFCIAHENSIDRGRQWSYSMGRKPAEAALATASALIDGLEYSAADSGDKDVDLAKFGNTYMAWKRTEGSINWTLHLPDSGPWVIVDVVGRKSPLIVDDNKDAAVLLTPSPVYILTQDEYDSLTR